MDREQIKGLFQNRRMERLAAARARDSAVLIPLVEREGDLSVLFEVRSASIAQGGEICFPGGRVEAGESPEETAVRETVEELSLSTDQVEMLAPLFEKIGPDGGCVSVYLGWLDDYRGTRSESEVERIFLLPLNRLLEFEPRIHDDEIVTVTGEDFPYELIPNGRDYPFRKMARRFYFYETEDGVIWGLTAELLFHFLELLRKGDVLGQRI